VGFYLLELIVVVEPLFDFIILDEVVEVEGQVVVGACRKDLIVGSIRTPPNLLHNILSELTLEEILDLILGDQVQRVSVLEVFLQQQKPHLPLMLHLSHILFVELDDFLSNGACSHM